MVVQVPFNVVSYDLFGELLSRFLRSLISNLKFLARTGGHAQITSAERGRIYPKSDQREGVYMMSIVNADEGRGCKISKI